jgi:hypothetical protein
VLCAVVAEHHADSSITMSCTAACSRGSRRAVPSGRCAEVWVLAHVRPPCICDSANAVVRGTPDRSVTQLCQQLLRSEQAKRVKAVGPTADVVVERGLRDTE